VRLLPIGRVSDKCVTRFTGQRNAPIAKP